MSVERNYVHRTKYYKQSPFSFRWEIEQLPKRLSAIGDRLDSPDFEVAPGVRMYLSVNQKKADDDDEEWLGAYLCISRKSPVKETTLSGYSIALLNLLKLNLRFEVKETRFSSNAELTGKGRHKHICYSDLVNPAEGFLKDDHLLTVLVEGSVFEGEQPDEREIVLMSEVNSSDLIQNQRNLILENLRKMFDEGILTDYVVKARDINGVEKQLKVHRNILAAGSEVFAAMLSNAEVKESSEGQVVIEDIQFEVMNALVRFLYSGDLSPEGIMEQELALLVAADKYQIGGLKTLVERRLSASFSIENVCDLLANADLLKAPHLKAQCAEFIRRHRKLVVKTKGWNRLSPRLMTFLFSGEEIDDGDDDRGNHGEDIENGKEEGETRKMTTEQRQSSSSSTSNASSNNSSSSVTANGGRKRRRQQ